MRLRLGGAIECFMAGYAANGLREEPHKQWIYDDDGCCCREAHRSSAERRDRGCPVDLCALARADHLDGRSWSNRCATGDGHYVSGLSILPLIFCGLRLCSESRFR